MKKRFLVVYEKGKKNYGGFAPDVAGCISLGDTVDEIRANLREALELYMETAVELGYPLPEPATTHVTLPIEGEIDPKTTYVVEHLTISIPRPKRTRTTGSRAPKSTKRAMQAA